MTDPIIDCASPEVAAALVLAGHHAVAKGLGTGSGMGSGYKVNVAVKKTPDPMTSDRYGGLALWNLAFRINLEQAEKAGKAVDLKTIDRVLWENEPAAEALLTDWNGTKAPLRHKDGRRLVIDDTYNGKNEIHISTQGRWRTSLFTINIPFEVMFGENLNALLRG